MEVNLITSSIQEEGAFGVEENYNDDNPNFEIETCGICMAAVIDRGVLDCCQHWFCFACIDNWATITNLCPLCQNEFQLITCVPVYDTIGSSKADEDSSSRDDEWCIEGQNNTVSFPSYYIDENAVTCLDGDGCKIRSGLVTIEGDSNLDTSIACDSCDLWYHAFCVGFDNEATSESTWLCPRCVVQEMPKNSDVDSVQSASSQYGPENVNSECCVQDTISRRVSVSVADSGETAVVVSQMVGEPSESVLQTVEVGKDLESETLVLAFEDRHKVTESTRERTLIEPKVEAQELELSLSFDTSCLPSDSLAHKQFRMSTDVSMTELRNFDGTGNPSGKSFDESYISNKLSDSSSSMGLHLGLSVGSFLSAGDMNNNGTEGQKTEDVKHHNPSEEYLSRADILLPNQATDNVMQHHPSEEYSPIADEIVPYPNLGAPGMTTDGKRKRPDCSADVGDINPKIETKVSFKKIRDEKTQPIASKGQPEASVPDDSKNCPSQNVVPKDSLALLPVQGNTTSDILSIVRTTNRKSSKGLGLARPNPAEKSSQEEENMAGLRVKKIMRRAADDKDSSVVVQTLRKEIREAVSNKTSKDFGENLFNPKLLDAFRTAIAGPEIEPVKKSSHLALKARKAILQKGNVRENLTKKIYGTSNGRRKRSWDRDREIEFWKHRCIGTTEPEKIETLKSVLGLLKQKSEGIDTEQESDRQSANPILSRLYLADASVLPRKDDIKPLLALKTAGNSEQNDKQLTLMEKFSKSSINECVSLEKHGKKNNVPSSENVLASNKVCQDRHSEGSLGSSSGGSKSKIKQEVVDKPVDIKSDKRKWALEFLARKTNVVGTKAANEKQEDNTVLKGNYPLLAQLPIDMRPALASSRHNKIPLSMRQAQLYHLTEHFLRKANLQVIRRTADTELAVADAINIEKEIADRSNIKQVYLNLCSQEILHRSDTKPSGGPESFPPSSVRTERSEQAANELSTDPVIESALRNAGLLSDSPPNSPSSNMDENGPSLDVREEGPDNVFEMDFHPDLDIYGDFEYNLEDEDYIGAAARKIANAQPEEGVPKLKLVFSTLHPERSNHSLDFEKTDMLENHTHSGLENYITDGGTDEPSVPLESLFGKEGEELSVAECEELYGLDTEPVTEKLPGEKLSGLIDEALSKDKDHKENENYVPNPNQAIETSGIGCNSSSGEDSTNHTQPGGNFESKEKKSIMGTNNQSNGINSVSKKVEAYIKEHIRPLWKSGVITAEQYKWAVVKTTDKVMKYHSKAKNASFLIKEGEKVKKLAEQYLETAPQKEKGDPL